MLILYIEDSVNINILNQRESPPPEEALIFISELVLSQLRSSFKDVLLSGGGEGEANAKKET